MKYLKYLMKLLKHIFCLLQESDKGYIIVPFGYNIIEVPSCCPPSRVFLSIEEPDDGCQICGQGINTVGCQITKYGFILYTDIKSDYAKIEWLIKFED